jgi:hypothetical protein
MPADLTEEIAANQHVTLKLPTPVAQPVTNAQILTHQKTAAEAAAVMASLLSAEKVSIAAH